MGVRREKGRIGLYLHLPNLNCCMAATEVRRAVVVICGVYIDYTLYAEVKMMLFSILLFS